MNFILFVFPGARGTRLFFACRVTAAFPGVILPDRYKMGKASASVIHLTSFIMLPDASYISYYFSFFFLWLSSQSSFRYHVRGEKTGFGHGEHIVASIGNSTFFTSYVIYLTIGRTFAGYTRRGF